MANPHSGHVGRQMGLQMRSHSNLRDSIRVYAVFNIDLCTACAARAEPMCGVGRVATTLTIAAISLSALIACSTLSTVVAPVSIKREIANGKMAEECFKLAKGERIRYAFKSSLPVAFNLHFHLGREVVMPVKVDRTPEESATFAAPQAEDYCLMWTNSSAVPAFVTGEWQRLE